MKRVIATHNSGGMFEQLEVSSLGFIDEVNGKIIVFERKSECGELIIRAIFSSEWSVKIVDI